MRVVDGCDVEVEGEMVVVADKEGDGGRWFEFSVFMFGSCLLTPTVFDAPLVHFLTSPIPCDFPVTLTGCQPASHYRTN